MYFQKLFHLLSQSKPSYFLSLQIYIISSKRHFDLKLHPIFAVAIRNAATHFFQNHKNHGKSNPTTIFFSCKITLKNFLSYLFANTTPIISNLSKTKFIFLIFITRNHNLPLINLIF